jgi:hypothetical protein
MSIQRRLLILSILAAAPVNVLEAGLTLKFN